MPTTADTKRGPRLSSTVAKSPLPRRSAGRRLYLWGLLPVAVLVGLWLLPMLVAQTRLLSWALDRATADLPCKVRVQQVSLGWFSPIRLNRFELVDLQGQPIAAAQSAESSRWLLGLVCNASNLGRFQLTEPDLTLVLRPDGSNLEDILAKLSKREGTGGSGHGSDFGLDIQNGRITVIDTAAQRQWQLQGLRAQITIPSSPDKAWEITTAGTIAGAAQPGRFDVALEMGPNGTPVFGEAKTPNALKLSAESIPLEMFQLPLGRLLGKPVRLTGQLHSALQGGWAGTGENLALDLRGDLRMDGFGLAGAFLGSEAIRLRQAQASGQGTWKNGRLEIQRITAQTDLSALEASGSLAVADLLAHPWPKVLKQTCHLRGQLDVAQLAAMLPQTLHLQSEMRVTSGQVQLALDSAPDSSGMRWRGQLVSSPLQAMQAGQPIAWNHPLQLAVDAHETAQGPVVDSLHCASSFLTATGSGTTDQGTLSVALNLNQLVTDLQMLVDLGELRLGGQGKTDVTWNRGANQAFRTEGRGHFENFECTLPEHPAWQEASIDLEFLATGKTDFTAATRLDSARLRLSTAQDRLEAQLVQAVPSLENGGVWPVELRAQGQLECWRPRLAPWLDLSGWQLGGTHQIQAQLTASRDQVELGNLQVALNQFGIAGPSVQLFEPSIQLTTAGRWQRATRRIEAARVSLASQTLVAQAKDAFVALPEQGSAQLGGQIHVQGDLGRVAQWVTLARPTPAAWRVAGQFRGDATLLEAGGKTALQWETVLENLAATHNSGRTIQQPAIRINGQGNYDSQRGTLQLARATLTSAMAQAEVAAQMVFQTPARLDLEGKIQYDLEQVSQLLQGVAGHDEIRLAGRGVCPIAYHGPLDLTTAEASAALGWTAAEIYGFRVGPGTLQAQMAGGFVNFRPMDLDVSEGKVHLAPRIQFTPTASELTLQGGRVAEQVRINPVMCANALQYVAPVVAGVASAEGRFSVELDRWRIPLEDVAQGDFAGRMLVHSIQMGPGPLIRELALAMGYTSPAQIAENSTIDFLLQQGRIYHRGVNLKFPDVTVRTEGSVGLDRTLDLVADMTLPPKLRNDKVMAVALPNQTIRLPIRGTLEHPQVDRNLLRQATTQVLQTATQNLLQDQMNKQFNRLLNPSR